MRSGEIFSSGSWPLNTVTSSGTCSVAFPSFCTRRLITKMASFAASIFPFLLFFLPTYRPFFLLLVHGTTSRRGPLADSSFHRRPVGGRGWKEGLTKQEVHLQRFDSSRAFASIFIRLMKTLAGANCFSNSAITGRWRASVFFGFFLFIYFLAPSTTRQQIFILSDHYRKFWWPWDPIKCSAASSWKRCE